MTYKSCPNCDKKIGGLLSSNYILNAEQITFIKLFHKDPSDAYCYDCGLQLVLGGKSQLAKQKEAAKSKIAQLLTNLPIATLHNPKHWDYTVVEMVTSQSVSGTGIISEIASSWTDLIGGQSDALTSKLENGEEICKNKLRLKALNLGANCIIGSDIDYAEVGGVKGMLMVCISGTAVILHNIDEVLPLQSEKLKELGFSIKELERINEIKLPLI